MLSVYTKCDVNHVLWKHYRCRTFTTLHYLVMWYCSLRCNCLSSGADHITMKHSETWVVNPQGAWLFDIWYMSTAANVWKHVLIVEMFYATRSVGSVLLWLVFCSFSRVLFLIFKLSGPFLAYISKIASCLHTTLHEPSTTSSFHSFLLTLVMFRCFIFTASWWSLWSITLAAWRSISAAEYHLCMTCLLGDQLVINSYESHKPSQKWSIEGTLVRWLGAASGEWQVIGVKPPIGPNEHNLHLHVGPLDTLISTQWNREFVYIAAWVFASYFRIYTALRHWW